MESKRQKQVAKMLQIALSDIFRTDFSDILEGAMLTISGVTVTPDLYTAKIYFSVFNHTNPEEIIAVINAHKKPIRGALGKRIRNQVRSIPELLFYKEDSLNDVFELEKIFKEIEEKRKNTPPATEA